MANLFRCGGGSYTVRPLWTTSEIVQGEYVNNNTGAFVRDNSGARSPLVEVKKDAITVFAATSWNNIYNAWYDENGVFISSFSMPSNTLVVVNKPANAKFVCISNSTASMQIIRAWDGDIM